MINAITAIDVGYSQTKAVSLDHKIMLPSVVAPYRELPMGDLLKNSGHVVIIRKVNGDIQRYFTGELALREGQGVTFTLDREKHLHPNHDILMLTAAYLLNAGAGTTLVAGLPVAYYRLQKDELRRHLELLHAEVSVDGGSFRRISFGKVIIYPQGAGALLTVGNLPGSGLVCLIDVGYKTTDYVTVEMFGGQGKPVASLCGSVEYGISRIHEAVAAEFEVKTGAPIDLNTAASLADAGKTTFRGKEIDLTTAIKAARETTARAITDRVLAALGPKGDFITKFYLAGGGALTLTELKDMFPAGQAQVIPDPQWANAEGFLTLSKPYFTA